MTIFHLVLLKTSATISPDVRQNLAVGVDRLREIEGVTFVRHGDLAKEGFYSGYQDRAKGYNYSILVGLADKNALKKYDTDTLHVQIKSTCIVPSLDAGAKDPILAVDWEGDAVAAPQFDELGQSGISAVTLGIVLVMLGIALRSRL